MCNFIFAVTLLAGATAVATCQNPDYSYPSSPHVMAYSKNEASSFSHLRSCSANPPSGNETRDCLNGLGWSCPPGLFCDNERGRCRCGAYPHNIVLCIDSVPSVLNCNCVTFDCVRNLTLAGSCLHTCGNRVNTSNGHQFYTPVPDSFVRSNEVCRRMNRTGALCGRCMHDHYPLAYSFNMSCVQYDGTHWNGLWYVMAAYLPLTLFYFIVLLFKINISSSYLHAIITHCQVISLPVMLRILLRDIALNADESYVTSAKVLFSVYGIWNLDFFRPFYSNLCLGMGILPTLALDYAIAVYPLLLMVVSYLLITLYDRNYRVITVMWSPFRRLLFVFRRNWDVRTSVIDAYATFFFLSNTKFLSVSFDLLVPTKVYKLHEKEYHYFLGLYYAQDIEYFGAEHLPYGILAIFVLSVFVILPVLLLLVYPFQFFQRFLNLFPFRWYILHTFVDSFQGCYKNGTEPGTRDCRWFSAAHFLIRIFLLMVYAVTLNVMFFVLGAVTLIAFSLFFLAVWPYRSAVGHNNLINVVFTLLLAALFILASAVDLSTLYMVHLVSFFRAMCFVITCLTLLYAIIIVIYWSIKSRRFGLSFLLRRIRGRGDLGYEELVDPHDGDEEGRGGGGGRGAGVGAM